MKALRNTFLTLLTVIALTPLLMSQESADQDEQSTQPSVGGAAAQSEASTTMDNQWHIAFLPYLWFAGMHGTTGVLGYNTSIHASAGDLLSHFNIGLMAATELRKNRLVLPVDMMWIRLSDNHGLPENEAGVNHIDFRAGQFLLTPEGGYRFVDKWNLKVDALVGLRYWHLGEKLTFSPAVHNPVSTSENWVDALGGAKFLMLLPRNMSIIIAGDAGGGGASPDYQVVSLFGVKVKENITLQAGWRYLDVHYRNNTNLFLYDVATKGGLIGATFHFK